MTGCRLGRLAYRYKQKLRLGKINTKGDRNSWLNDGDQERGLEMIPDAEGDEMHFVGGIHAKEEREEFRVVFEFKASVVKFPFCKCSQVFRNVILEPGLNVESKSRIIGRGAGRVWRQSFPTDSGKEDSRSKTDIWLQPGLMIAKHKIKRRQSQDAKVCTLKSCACCHARYCGVLKSGSTRFRVGDFRMIWERG